MIEIKNVSKTYNTGDTEFKALDNIDLSINKGEFVVILGPSGAGKSTLLNLIGGMDTPTTGSIKIDGEEISNYNENNLSEYRAENIGFIFQFYNILPTLTVLENVQLVKDIVKKPKSAKRILKDVGLEKHYNKFPNQLSGGQRQRVATARALVDDSKLLIADEPTGALDSANSENLMALLQEINQKFEITIILVTHDPAAAKYSSRMLLLKDGHIIEDLYRNGMSNDAYLETIYQKTR